MFCSRKRKNLLISIPFLVVFLATLILPFPSSADTLAGDAASLFGTVPINTKGWIRSTPSLSSTLYDSASYSYSMNTPSASYLWRFYAYFDYSSDLVLGTASAPARSLISWQYDGAMTMDINYIYQFKINIRFTSSDSVANQTSDFSKLLLCFGDTSTHLNSATLTEQFVDNHFVGFAPSSYTWNSSYGTCELVYNVPVYPETLFSGSTVFTDSGTGIEYIEVPTMAIRDYGTGAIGLQLNQSSGRYRYACQIFPRSTSSVKRFTVSEWNSHVLEDGFDSLSSKIDTASGLIIDAIDSSTTRISGKIDQGFAHVSDQLDDLIDSPDHAVDMSGLEDAREPEEQLTSLIQTTYPFSAFHVSQFYDLAIVNRVVGAMTTLSGWYQYAYDNCAWIFVIVYFSLSASIVYLTFKFLI